MRSDHAQSILEMRDEGYLVVAWTPGELRGLDAEDYQEMEDRLVERGNDMIDQFLRENGNG